MEVLICRFLQIFIVIVSMKLMKTASGKQTVKLSKSDWESIGINAGWLKVSWDEFGEWKEEAQLRGQDSSNAYELEKNYGGDIDAARRDRLEGQQSEVDWEKQELYDILVKRWKDKSSPHYQVLKDRIEGGDFKNKFHLINSIKKRQKS